MICLWIPEKDQFILPRGRGQRGSFIFLDKGTEAQRISRERKGDFFFPPRSVAKPKRDPRTLTRRPVPLSVSQRPVCSVGCLLHFDNPDAQDPERGWQGLCWALGRVSGMVPGNQRPPCAQPPGRHGGHPGGGQGVHLVWPPGHGK